MNYMENFENEIWKPAKYIYEDGRTVNFENYEVSTLGRVKSLYYYRSGKSEILKPRYANRPYLRIMLYKNSISYSCSIHRLVSSTFQDICGKWFNGAVCNHKDENPTNNNATNLEWCTKKYNSNYGTAIDRRIKKTTNGKKAYIVIQYDLNMNFIKEWPSTMEIERITGFKNNNIGSCCRGKYKQAYGYIWKYKKDCHN